VAAPPGNYPRAPPRARGRSVRRSGARWRGRGVCTGNEGRRGLTFIQFKILRVRVGTALGKTKVLEKGPSVTAARARARARAAGARARSPEAGARARAPTPAAADALARAHEGGSLAHEAALGHGGDPARVTAIAATRLRAVRGPGAVLGAGVVASHRDQDARSESSPVYAHIYNRPRSCYCTQHFVLPKHPLHTLCSFDRRIS